jgi:hypothetical protein
MRKQQIPQTQKEKITLKDILNWVIPFATALIYAWLKFI